MKWNSACSCLLLGIMVIACTPEAPEPPESITAVKLSLDGGSSFQWEEGKDPDTLRLAAQQSYQVSVQFLDGTKSPAEDLTSEISDEKEDHLICFEVIQAALSIVRSDQDANGLEVGLRSTWESGDSSTGNLILTLKHQPDVKDGSCAPGETDVEVNFPVLIQ